jgi:hypothetical protein
MADLDIGALTVDQLADLLRKAGSAHVTVDRIRADIQAGAPVTAEGRLSLVAYAAWLIRRMGRPDGP